MTAPLLKIGFPPIASVGARILVLGSLPGDKSIQQQQYYGHPQNQFWRIVAAVYGRPALDTYAAKLEFLKAHDIAVWDVLARAERAGSLDTAIRHGVPNDIRRLLNEHPGIRSIALNGHKAHGLFQRHFGQAIRDVARPLTTACLPSTSPAATRSFGEKVREWEAFLRNASNDIHSTTWPS